ncbi:hypothetical protein DI273_17360 [Streptomyces violascens]|nr:hypothetical protein DI273_17360 [Streptomyces violascens]
MYRFPSSVSGH